MKNGFKKVIFFILIATIFDLTSSCKKDNPKPDPAILGKWFKYIQFNSITLKQVIIFKDNGKYDAVSGDTPIVDYGTYSTNGNELTIVDNDVPQNTVCKTTIGRYSYLVQETHLIINLISDTCDSRAHGFPGTWTKE